MTFPYYKVVMDKQLLPICALTFIIHIIGTLAYSVRIAGIRMRRLALFSILVLLSRPLNAIQRAFCRAVEHFQVHRSAPKLLLHAVFKGGLSYIKTSASLPKPANVTGLREKSGVSISMTAMNVIATALWTVGVFAALYAGVLDPSVRVTSSTVSSIINSEIAVQIVDSEGDNTNTRNEIRVKPFLDKLKRTLALRMSKISIWKLPKLQNITIPA